MNEKDELGERFRAIRKKLNMTQGEFAQSIGMSQSFIAEVERGGKEPSRSLLIAIARAYDVSLDWLLLGKKNYATLKPMAESEADQLRTENEALKKENSVLEADIKRIEDACKKLDVENREISKELIARLRQLVDTQNGLIAVANGNFVSTSIDARAPS